MRKGSGGVSFDSEGGSGSSHWHLDKRVNLSHIFATLALAAGMFSWGSAVDKRVAVLETHQQQIDKENQRQDDTANETLRLLRDEVREMRGELRGLRDTLNSGRSGR